MFKKQNEERARQQEIIEDRQRKAAEHREQMTDAERYMVRKKANAEFLAKPGIYEDNKAVSAVVVSTQEETKTEKSVGRALVGVALFGVAGAAVGAASAKGKTTVVKQRVTFSVKYASGRTATETVEVGSKRFNELSALLISER